MTTTASTDAELLAHARRGDETAFAELYVRHEAAARRLANTYARRAGDVDDLVNGAFERVLQALRKGLGPTEAFRAYLFVTLRRLATDRIVRTRDAPYDEIPEPVRAEEHDELDLTERTLIVDAYESLPGRWQTVLWHTAVEGRAPRELAPTLGMSPNAAAALAYRAREKLRQAYLQAHLQTAPRPECEPHRSRLGAYVRDGLGTRDRGATADHIDDCSSCRGLVAELADVNRLLVRALFPLFLSAGEVAAALTATTALTGAAAGDATGGALRGAVSAGRRTLSRARSNPAAASTVVGALLVIAVIAGALTAAHDDEVALPIAPPGEQPVTPPFPGDDAEPPEVPLEVAPPTRRAEPIAASSGPAPATTPPPIGAAPDSEPGPGEPSTAPPSTDRPPPSSEPPSPAPTTPTTRPSVPPTTPPGTAPPPQAPPPPTTAPPTTQPPSSSQPCHAQVQLGGIFDVWICLDVGLLGRQSGGRGWKFSQ